MNRDSHYFKQAQLLLRALPQVAKEHCFALKGGTAINYFVREVPRLSVDIDLVYLPIESRDKTLKSIDEALNRLATSLKQSIPGIRIQKGYIKGIKGIIKLYVKTFDIQVTIEPNLIIRGSLHPCKETKLSKKAEDLFGLSASINVLSVPDLYGGKLCAALDRQHPRDLFDVKVLFEHEGITDVIRQSFVLYLAGHDRPIHELLNPQLRDLEDSFKKEFLMIAVEPITIESLIETREELIKVLQNQLTDKERRFLMSIKQGTPQWDFMDVAGIEKLPAIQWKVINIHKLSSQKHEAYTVKLKKVLGL